MDAHHVFYISTAVDYAVIQSKRSVQVFPTRDQLVTANLLPPIFLCFQQFTAFIFTAHEVHFVVILWILLVFGKDEKC